METINSIPCNSARENNNAALAALIMSTSSSLDLSNHSWATPPITEPQQPPTTPVSPNAVEQFPGDASSDAKRPLKSTKQTLACSDAAAFPTIASAKADNVSPPLQCSCTDDSTVSLSSLSSRSNSTTTTSSTRSVRFSPLVRVKDTLSRHDISPKERFDYWIQDHEFLMIKRRNQMTILAILEAQEAETRKEIDNTISDTNTNTTLQEQQQQQPPQQSCTHTDNDTKTTINIENCCLRGLESAFPNENLRKRSYRFAALEEVFMEQEDQYYAGIYDDEAIAHVYLEVTVECRFRAEFRAILDRKDIEDYLQEGDHLQWTNTTNNNNNCESDEDEFAIE